MEMKSPHITLESASREGCGQSEKAWPIRAGFAPTPFGEALLAQGPRGICHLSFCEASGKEPEWRSLLTRWSEDTVVRDEDWARSLAAQIFPKNGPLDGALSLRLFVRGTDFQVKVWEALLGIPCGQTTNYGQIATAIGQPTATRATGTAIGRNPIAWLIPCHRVIRLDGTPGNYRWGPSRKLAMLEWEKANH